MYIKYYIYMEQNIKKKPKTDIPPNISHTFDVQQTADSYLPLVVTSKVKTLLNIWWYSNSGDKLMQRSRHQEGPEPRRKVIQ